MIVVCILLVILAAILTYRAKCYADYADEQIKLAESWMNEALVEKRKMALIRDQASKHLAHAVRVSNEKFLK